MRRGEIVSMLAAILLIGGATAARAAEGAWRERVLVHFANRGDGANPAGGLTPGGNGTLYGTVPNGGAHGFGAVFEVDPAAGSGGAARVLYSFSGGDGAYPMAGLARGAAGELYGTTLSGGAHGEGTVFALAPAGGGWSERVLYSFTGGRDGGSPSAGVSIDASGALCGTTLSGGTAGRGVAFRLARTPTGTWQQTVLHSFAGGGDGEVPFGGLAIGPGNALYGTTTYGGASSFGTVFVLTPQPVGPAWSERVLYSFTGKADGGLPGAGVVLDAAGGLYGTTRWGGSHASGTAFKLTPPSAPGGRWTETVLHSFGNGFGRGADGGAPIAGVAFGAGGLYGTTNRGGAHDGGTVYKLTPPAAGDADWRASVLHSFGGTDGSGPAAGVVLVGGKLFGTTFRGGRNGAGTAFELSP